MSFPCSPPYPALRREHRAHWSSRGHPPAWGNPRAFSPSCPANRPRRPAAAPAPAAPSGPRLRPRWAEAPRRENLQTAREQLASAGLPRAAFLFAPPATVYAAVSAPNPPGPHGYPGKKARLVAPAPLRSCRNFGCEKWKRRTYGHTAGVEPAPRLPRGPCGGPGGRPAAHGVGSRRRHRNSGGDPRTRSRPKHGPASPRPAGALPGGPT